MKVFDQEKFAQEFLDGMLFMNRLSYFQDLEDDSTGSREDKNEAIKVLWQPNNVTLRFNDIEISKNDLAGPISVQMNRHRDICLFCVYAAHSGDFENLSDDNIAAFRQQLKIHEDCLAFGKFAVVIGHVQTFVSRVKEAVKTYRFSMSAKLVDYYDPSHFDGTFSDQEAIFKKQIKYQYQSEFRFAINTGIPGGGPIKLFIGNIRDVACMYDVTEINNNLVINLPNMNT